ncbi:MAG: DUF3986 family protein [Ectobacillus sp.]
MEHSYEDGHLHLGYYEDGHDLEAIAYKRKGEDIWDVYFDFTKNVPPSMKDKVYIPYLGYHILVIQSNELTYEEGSEKFAEWLKDYKVI